MQGLVDSSNQLRRVREKRKTRGEKVNFAWDFRETTNETPYRFDSAALFLL